MDDNFWLEKWQAGNIGFHQSKVMPLLLKHWPTLNLPKGSKVLVPLAGKSLDVAWLAEQDHDVTAVELSPLAIEQFFAEHDLKPNITQTGKHTIYSCNNITYICGDIFKLEASFFSQFAACYDRAALIALTSDLRKNYVNHLYGNLDSQSKTLLITITYPQSEMQGPPFAIDNTMIKEFFADKFIIDQLDQRDILQTEPKFQARGLSAMSTSVYSLIKN